VAVVALVVFGPKGLADAAKSLGQALRAFQPTIREVVEVSQDLRGTLEKELGLDEIREAARTPAARPRPVSSGSLGEGIGVGVGVVPRGLVMVVVVWCCCCCVVLFFLACTGLHCLATKTQPTAIRGRPGDRSQASGQCSSSVGQQPRRRHPGFSGVGGGAPDPQRASDAAAARQGVEGGAFVRCSMPAMCAQSCVVDSELLS